MSKLHKYACGECPTSPFFTVFEPKFDPPAYCPNCGRDELVTYLGEVEMVEVENDDNTSFHGKDQGRRMAENDEGATL